MTEILTVDASRAADVLSVIHEAFANRPPLDPPATALDETLESVGEALDAHGGLLVEHEGQPVGALLLEPRGRLLGLRRVGVLDSVRGLGVAAQMADEGRGASRPRASSAGWRSRRASSCRGRSSSGAGSGTSSPAATATG